jgi:hypothetical protein
MEPFDYTVGKDPVPRTGKTMRTNWQPEPGFFFFLFFFFFFFTILALGKKTNNLQPRCASGFLSLLETSLSCSLHKGSEREEPLWFIGEFRPVTTTRAVKQIFFFLSYPSC